MNRFTSMPISGLVVLTLLGLFQGLEAGYNYDYMIENCVGNTSSYVRDLTTPGLSTYGFVRPVRTGGYPQGMDCSVTVRAPPDHYLIVKFRRMEIYQASSSACVNYDYLTVSGNKSTYVYCGYRVPSHSLISTGNQITIRFVSKKNIDSNSRVGFDIYYTAFHRGYCDESGSYPKEFRCRSGSRCIPSELKCDNLDNCGDWSDERSKTCGLSTGMTVCLSLLGILVGGTCCLALFMWVCAKKKERSASARRRAEPVVEVRCTHTTSPPEYRSGANAALGEKPPLPEYDNYAYSADQYPTPWQGPPSYDSIAPPTENPLNPASLVNPTYGTEAPESIRSGRRVAPAAPQTAPLAQESTQASQQSAPRSTMGNGRPQESTPANNQVAPEYEPIPAAANGTGMPTEAAAGEEGMYEEVDLAENPRPTHSAV